MRKARQGRSSGRGQRRRGRSSRWWCCKTRWASSMRGSRGRRASKRCLMHPILIVRTIGFIRSWGRNPRGTSKSSLESKRRVLFLSNLLRANSVIYSDRKTKITKTNQFLRVPRLNSLLATSVIRKSNYREFNRIWEKRALKFKMQGKDYSKIIQIEISLKSRNLQAISKKEEHLVVFPPPMRLTKSTATPETSTETSASLPKTTKCVLKLSKQCSQGRKRR